MIRLREAMGDVCDIENQLVEVDFQLGRAIYELKNSQFGEFVWFRQRVKIVLHSVFDSKVPPFTLLPVSNL